MLKKIILILVVFCVTFSVFAQESQVTSAELEKTQKTVQEIEQKQEKTSAVKYIAAAIAVGIGCLAGGMAVGKIGAAAMGAMSENSELSGKALPFVGLAEGICLWGFLVALIIVL